MFGGEQKKSLKPPPTFGPQNHKTNEGFKPYKSEYVVAAFCWGCLFSTYFLGYRVYRGLYYTHPYPARGL